jgi:predicted alpha/beta superfamily hydrolase
MTSLNRAVPVILGCLTVAVGPAVAQQLQTRPVPSERVESFTFQSPSMGVRYAINVGIPKAFKPGDGKKYPTLIVTDGDWAFAGVNGGAQSLDGVIDPIFVVSIGNALDEGTQLWTQRRVYEFSPPNWDRKDAFGEAVTKVCHDLHTEEAKCTGGAARFLNVIVSELVPLVAAKYPIDSSQLGLFGISAGGFFTSWVVFQSNSPFKKYLISSPAMAYGDGSTFREEERYAKEHKDLPVSIYLGAGVLETGDQFLEGIGRIVSGMSHLAGVLGSRHYPGLKLVTEYHPGMGHTDVMGTTVARGLRTLYGKP